MLQEMQDSGSAVLAVTLQQHAMCVIVQRSCISYCVCFAMLHLQELQDPGSAELGLTMYQLATTYYSHDMLQDAGPALQRASALLRTHYPPEHDLVRQLLQGDACCIFLCYIACCVLNQLRACITWQGGVVG
jgi:hypothetical protein